MSLGHGGVRLAYHATGAMNDSAWRRVVELSGRRSKTTAPALGNGLKTHQSSISISSGFGVASQLARDGGSCDLQRSWVALRDLFPSTLVFYAVERLDSQHSTDATVRYGAGAG